MDVIATHPRCYDRGRQIEDAAHVEALVAQKRQAREHRALDRLHHAVPRSRELLRLVAERGGNIGRTTLGLLRVLDAHTAEGVDAAIAEALTRGTPHVGAVRQALDRARAARGEPPPLGLHLPDSPKLEGLVVRPHALSIYDQLTKNTSHKEPSNDSR